MLPVNALSDKYIDTCIASTEYVVVKDHAVFCVLTLENGAVVSGKSMHVAPLVPEEVSKALALEAAKKRVWEREEYVARFKQHNKIQFTDQYMMKSMLNEAYLLLGEGGSDWGKAMNIIKTVGEMLKGQVWRESRFSPDDMIAAQQKMQG